MRDFMAQSKSPEPTVESVLEKVHDIFSTFNFNLNIKWVGYTQGTVC